MWWENARTLTHWHIKQNRKQKQKTTQKKAKQIQWVNWISVKFSFFRPFRFGLCFFGHELHTNTLVLFDWTISPAFRVLFESLLRVGSWKKKFKFSNRDFNEHDGRYNKCDLFVAVFLHFLLMTQILTVEPSRIYSNDTHPTVNVTCSSFLNVAQTRFKQWWLNRFCGKICQRWLNVLFVVQMLLRSGEKCVFACSSYLPPIEQHPKTHFYDQFYDLYSITWWEITIHLTLLSV